MVFGVSNKGRTFRDLASHYSIYFCGHLHKLIAGQSNIVSLSFCVDSTSTNNAFDRPR